MGYIVPVNHEQYTQYANRLIPVKQDHLELTPIKRTSLASAFVKKEHYIASEKNSLKENKEMQKILSNITGKGYVINEWI